ncbi:ion channel [uncultured Tateyamaria sp.]|uniref:ion channel n=1 Tax=uncultured Tateyamaria sp. TaxID=455651 RepID=UPI002625721F|nr:ion channel [uncultured Tateyamaria sp.]
MTAASQILLGSTLLTMCALIHVGVVAILVPFLSHMADWLERSGSGLRTLIITGLNVLILLIAHTLQVWSWALAFFAMNAFDDFPTSIYFSTATYTTLGYGDLLLDPGLRIFGTFAAITGLLTFGISTALLMGVIVRLLPSIDDED